MIINEKVKMKWGGMTREHYESRGYVYSKKDDEFDVWVSELTERSNIKVKYICDYCDAEGIRQYGTLIKKREFVSKDTCARCASKKHNEVKLVKYGSLKSEFPEIAKEWSVEDNEIKPSEVTPQSGRKVIWKCDVGHKWETAVYSRTGLGTGCPVCTVSKGELAVSQILDGLGINYSREFTYDDLIGLGGGLLRYDFAILGDLYQTVAHIEYDGPFHFRKMFPRDGHELIKKHDLIKNEYCSGRSIPLLRIPYKDLEDIEGIVTEFIKTLKLEAD